MKALDAKAAAIGIAVVLAIGGCGGSTVTVINSTTTTTVAPRSQPNTTTTTTVPPAPQTTSASGGGPCDGQPCIGDWQKEAAEGGTVVQCSDGTWSHAGGLSGACSDHGGETTGGTATNGGGSGSTVQDLPVQCGYGVAGSSGMTCTFAENAFYEYWQASGGDPTRAESISVWSPDVQQSYPLSCESGGDVVDCVGTGGGGVSLDARFTDGAVSAYTNAEAAAYAASGKLGPPPSGFTPGDQNPNDSDAAACESAMEVGPHSDCAVAQQVAADLAQGMWSAPGSDTVSEGGNTITFNCSLIGHDQSQASQPGIYSCVSARDPQDWFEFAFT
ncbi:MAG: hypothetical protein JOZ98_23050 [Solirubrobacterales bacterium]|nr:hypothetical protein [Solirubrobacterales bacterium]